MNYIKIAIPVLLLAFSFPFPAGAQYDSWFKSTESPEHAEQMQWWRDAKFGMFVHWGVYVQTGGVWGDRVDHTEWLMQEARIPMKEYRKLPSQFNPVRFNSDELADLAKKAGQKYFVFTTKHHDGFCMFDTAVDTFNVVKATPYGRDILGALSNSMRSRGIKMGVYYSQGMDWNHVGGEVPNGQEWDPEHIGDFSRYLDEVSLPQLNEILSNYGEIDLLWFDAGSSHISIPQCNRLDSLVKAHKGLISNNRLECKRRDFPGDYFTPEQYLPAVVFDDNDWEVCMTMNGHWMYNAYDEKWKTPTDIIRMLCEVVAKGGNLLLNVGPDRYGRIPENCKRTLEEVGKWLETNGESIYGTKCSPYQWLPFGWATRKGNMLYLLIRDWQKEISLPGRLDIEDAWLLSHREIHPRVHRRGDRTAIELPAICPDNRVSVVALKCKSEFLMEPELSPSATILLNGTAVPELNDSDFIHAWTAPSGDCVFDISFPQSTAISGMSIVEAFHPWDDMGQDYKLEALVDGRWMVASEGRSKGLGYCAPFSEVISSQLKLTVRNPKVAAVLKEIILYRY